MTGPCVICGKETSTMFVTEDGVEQYVHNYHEPGYFGCKEIWRYRQELRYKRSEQYWNDLIGGGDESARDALADNQHDPDFFLDDRDSYDDYRSYISSREWEIKALIAKRKAGRRCQRCSQKGDRSILHAHHKTYDRLYAEWPEDIEVLCQDCHKKEHGIPA